MTDEEFNSLAGGDFIRHKESTSGEYYTVLSNYGDRVTAVRTVDMTNPSEWDLINKVVHRKRVDNG